MEMTDELASAIADHQGAVRDLSQALHQYRDGGASLTRGEPEPGHPLPLLDPAAEALEPAAEKYEQTSLTVAGFIIDHLVVSPGNGSARFDDDATTRLTALIAIDAKIAEQAALLTEMRAPQGPGDEPQTRPLAEPEIEDLGPELDPACQPMFEELRQGNQATTVSGPPAETVQHYVDEILYRAGQDVVGTISSSLSWEIRIRDILAHQLAQVLGWPQDALNQLAHGLWALRRLLARALRQVLLKVSALAGQHAKKIAETIIENFQQLQDAIRHGPGQALGLILQVQGKADQAEALVRAAQPDKAAAAMRACQEVDDHHYRRRRAVKWLNKALPACRMIHTGGLAVEAVAAAVLLIYSIWLAHDHLDSPVLEDARLPKDPGLLTEVKAAVE